MNISEALIGVKIDIDFYDIKINKNLILASEFEMVEDDDTLYIAAPMYRGLIYPLRLNTVITGYFLLKRTEIDIELYSFCAKVIGREKNNNVHLLKIKLTSEIKKEQRRQFYRLECNLPVKVRELVTDDDSDIEYVQTITKNISGGGLAVFLKEKPKNDVDLECILKLEDKYLYFIVSVVRIETSDSSQIYDYEIGLRYTKIYDADREKVIRYVFIEQRRLRKEGKI